MGRITKHWCYFTGPIRLDEPYREGIKKRISSGEREDLKRYVVDSYSYLPYHDLFIDCFKARDILHRFWRRYLDGATE